MQQKQTKKKQRQKNVLFKQINYNYYSILITETNSFFSQQKQKIQKKFFLIFFKFLLFY